MKTYLRSTSQPARFAISNEKGHTVMVEGKPEHGGSDSAPSPTELLMMSQAGCTAIDVTTLLKKMRQPIVNMEIESSASRTLGQIPDVLDTLHLHFRMYGDIDPAKAEKAIRMSIYQYCPISKMIDRVTNISYSFEILDESLSAPAT